MVGKSLYVMGNAAVALERRCEAEWRCEAERPETCLMKHDSSRADESMAALCRHLASSTWYPACQVIRKYTTWDEQSCLRTGGLRLEEHERHQLLRRRALQAAASLRILYLG